MANYDTDSVKVKAVQTAINAAGYASATGKPALVVDGIYGPLTAAGVQWFEKLHGLTVDAGIIGDQVMAATVATPPGGAIPGAPKPLTPPLVTLHLGPIAQQNATNPQWLATHANVGGKVVQVPAGSPGTLVNGAVVPGTPTPLAAPGIATMALVAPGAAMRPSIPEWLGLLLGGAGGGLLDKIPALAPTALGRLPVIARVLGGGIVGFGLGWGLARLFAPKTVTPAPAPAATATVHGEFGYDYGMFDLDFDEGDVVAGEIGVRTRHRHLKA